MEKFYSVLSAEAQHKDAPDTFRIPIREKRERVKPGFYVKLIFHVDQPPQGERMWVKVVKRRGMSYIGTLASSPAFMKDLIPGEEIVFGPEHICDISSPDE